jgi:signal transduction histidine kinase
LRTYQLEQENLKLNQIIKERTSEIRSQKEEIQVQAENLVQLGTFKEKMISMIVHDLKNPLSMILHGSEKASVKNAAQEMNNLVENMLDINKFEQAKLKLYIENQLLNNLIHEAYKKVEYLFDIKIWSLITR